MHLSDSGEDLETLMRHHTFQREALVVQGLPADNPRVLGLDALIDACRRALVAVQVSSIAIERFHSRGGMHG
jgi:hypothetical protein